MADKELAHVRTRFVADVSIPVIKGLLDDLYEDRVLNDEEKEEVLQANQARADKARCLIDMVRNKGAKASDKLISRLKDQDSNLHDKLNLGKGPQPADPGPASPPKSSKQSVSQVLIPCDDKARKMLEREKKKERKDQEIYIIKEKSERKRLALLINNVNFSCEEKNRHGANKDEERMERLLTDLGYKVEKHIDLPAEAIDQCVKEFSQREDHSHSDSTFVVIMSHGMRDFICGTRHGAVDGAKKVEDLFSINNIFKHLNAVNCVGLRDKPKVIVIQACRGSDRGGALVSDSASEMTSGLEEDGCRKVHKEKDFATLMACTPDTVSFRHTVNGALLIQHLVDTVNTHAHEDHIEELFRKGYGQISRYS
ncbi:hypothetical protein AGOR_G00126440 [Albula goreensis]|uniref:Uncharacterized protein n=1 Tax=Albula goreensis TaxID=1534307 RepID=A0A8T3DH21_9TELE|nr:hypothetical protein AGOR_G00126440 [Albula goreensis]